MNCSVNISTVAQTSAKYLANIFVGKQYLLIASITRGREMSVARMYDAHIFAKIIEICDDFKDCCILCKEDVSDIIEHLTVL